MSEFGYVCFYVTVLGCRGHCVNLAIWLLYVNKLTYLSLYLRWLVPGSLYCWFTACCSEAIEGHFWSSLDVNRSRRRRYVLDLSVRLSVRPLSNLWTRYIENDFDANWNKSFAGQGHEMIDFRASRSKVKVTLSRSYIWRPDRGINFDPFGREAFLVLEVICKKINKMLWTRWEMVWLIDGENSLRVCFGEFSVA